jgi:polysaccharide biosynthesis transport protein
MNGPNILSILSQHKRTLLVSGIATACLGFGISRIMPQSYLGEGSLIVENKPSVSEGTTSPSAVSNVLTQVDVLQSRGLLQRVARDLDLEHDPMLKPSSRVPWPVRDWLVALQQYVTQLRETFSDRPRIKTAIDETADYIQKHFSAAAKENSSIITVQFLGGSPETAARVTNAIMTTYLTTIQEARDDQITKADKWASEQINIRRRDVDEAADTVITYARSHNLSEAQGANVTAIQLSDDQKQLVLARVDLAQKEAAFNTVLRGESSEGAEEILSSKVIQGYKELEAKALAQINTLPPGDPRREPLNRGLAAVRAKLAAEIGFIRYSLARDVQVARAKVDALTASIGSELKVANDTTVAGTMMKQLVSDLDAKRQLYIAFFTQAGHARVAVEQMPTAHVLFAAVPPERPRSSYGLVSIVIGFLAGVGGAAGLIVLQMTPKVNFTGDIATLTGLPVFGSLPEVKRGNSLLASPRGGQLATETFRAMWLEMQPEPNQAATILVTSSTVGEGKTTVAVAMARSFAADGFRVLLVDADMRHPQVASRLGLKKSYGLESVLTGKMSFQQAIATIDGFDCLFGTERVDNPMKMLSSAAFADLLQIIRARYDFVIFDSAPVLQVADPVLLSKFCQHIIFVVQASRLSGEAVREATHRFTEAGRGNIITLLTRVKQTRPAMVGYHSYGKRQYGRPG